MDINVDDFYNLIHSYKFADFNQENIISHFNCKIDKRRIIFCNHQDFIFIDSDRDCCELDKSGNLIFNIDDGKYKIILYERKK